MKDIYEIDFNKVAEYYNKIRGTSYTGRVLSGYWKNESFSTPCETIGEILNTYDCKKPSWSKLQSEIRNKTGKLESIEYVRTAWRMYPLIKSLIGD